MASHTDALTVGATQSDPGVISALPILVVHAHSSCNCRCVMCDIWKTAEAKSFTSASLAPHLESIRKLGVRWIVFSGGEPLLNPELPVLCSLLKEENIHLTLLTTGLLMKKCAVEVAKSFDDVIVSLDGPPGVHDEVRRVTGAFALVQEGVIALREQRPDIAITARCTIQKANHHCLCATADAAKLLNLNSISFLAADLTSTAFNRTLAWPMSRQQEVGLTFPELEVLEKQIEQLIGENPPSGQAAFIAESPEKLRRIVRHFRAQLGLDTPVSPECNAPWVSAVVEIDGTVRPCFFHRPIGNLRDGGLDSILNSEKALTFRTELDVARDPICNRCVCSLNYRG